MIDQQPDAQPSVQQVRTISIQERSVRGGDVIVVNGYRARRGSLKARFAEGGYQVHETQRFLLFTCAQEPKLILVHWFAPEDLHTNLSHYLAEELKPFGVIASNQVLGELMTGIVGGTLYLSGIGFLAQLGTSPCSCPTFLRPFAFTLTELGRPGQFAGSRDGLRPGLRHQPAARQDKSVEQHGHQSQASTHDATQSTFRRLIGRPCASTTSNMRDWQVCAWAFLLLLLLCLAAEAHRPDLGHRHRQPEPLHTTSCLHFAVVPAPQAAFEVFVAGFDPMRIPYRLTSACGYGPDR